MSLWVDKHRPKRLSKLDYHTKQAQYLELLVKGGDFPHLLVYGPPGIFLLFCPVLSMILYPFNTKYIIP